MLKARGQPTWLPNLSVSQVQCSVSYILMTYWFILSNSYSALLLSTMLSIDCTCRRIEKILQRLLNFGQRSTLNIVYCRSCPLSPNNCFGFDELGAAALHVSTDWLYLSIMHTFCHSLHYIVQSMHCSV